MRKTLFILATVSVFACTNAKQDTTTQTYAPTPTGLSGIKQANATNAANATPSTNQNGELLNPVHGAPGHDCSLPIGAPLNKPAKADTSKEAANKTPLAETQKPRLNPAHGMPGHDCAVAVGAPLTAS